MHKNMNLFSPLPHAVTTGIGPVGTYPFHFHFFISFHFHFIKEGSPSTRVVLQGALHLKTLIYNYILKRIITI